MGKEWTEYYCKSGQTLFAFNKQTGEHMWPLGLPEAIEYRVIYNQPAEQKQVSTIATQTDDTGCNNGYMSMYVNTDTSQKTSDARPPQCQPSTSNTENTLICAAQTIKFEPGYEQDTYRNEQEEDQSSEMAYIDSLVERSNDDDDNGHITESTTRCDYNQVHDHSLNINENDETCDNDSKSEPDDGDDTLVGVVRVVAKQNEDIEVYCDLDENECLPATADHNNEHFNELDINHHVDLHRQSARYVKKKTGYHQCSVCKKVLTSKVFLQKHAALHTNDKTCDNDSQSEPDDGDDTLVGVVRVVAKQNEDMKVYCDLDENECLPTMADHNDEHTKELATNHHVDLRSAKNVKKKTGFHKCSVCNKVFTSKGFLQRHAALHTREKHYKCKFCKKAFSNRNVLATHLRRHTGEKPYECSYCKKHFSSHGILYKHIRTHTKEKPFECSYCGMRFSRKDSLNDHVRARHTGEKPYECKVCKKKFLRRCQLREHLNTHTGEMPYECTVCKQKFLRRRQLREHVDIHTSEQHFECTVCQKKFTKRRYFKEHVCIPPEV